MQRVRTGARETAGDQTRQHPGGAKAGVVPFASALRAGSTWGWAGGAAGCGERWQGVASGYSQWPEEGKQVCE